MQTDNYQLDHWQAHPGILAPRETQCILQVTAGCTNKMGAKALGIAPTTFTSAVQRAMYKLNTYSRAQTVAEAIRRGIISTLMLLVVMQCMMPSDHNLQRTSTRLRTVRTIRITRNPKVPTA